jgi:site-specific DNA-methyltransferase (adenine-specific)
VAVTEIVQIGDATLYHGDCLEILPTLGKVDAVVTDPPYGIADKWKGGGGGKRSSWRFDPSEARSWDTHAPDCVPQIASQFEQAIVWGGNYFALPPSRCWLVWDKKQNDRWTTAQCELAWTSLDRPVRAFRMAQCEQANEGHKSHPTQKPLALMEWCLKWVTAPSILDPFMGSGTTGVACANLGRKFIGIEKERKYFDIACERIDAAYRQGRLFA